MMDNSNKQRNRSPSAVKADSLIRRVLRVGDPWNATEVAAGLKRLYSAEESALANEAAGFPVVRQINLKPAQIMRETATSKDMEQARDDVERDLNALVNNNLLKDIQPELSGWANAIRATVSDGTNSARFALDSRQRDNTFAARRSLRDFARLARYVGALSPHVNPYYRRLAQSLDEVGSVLLVMLGEQLAEAGISGSGIVLNAPASELQDRRDAIMQTLRTLIGSKNTAYGNDEWPWGMAAYRELIQRLDRNGQTDLRSILHEDNMARLLDDLLDQATIDGSKGLRAMAASAQVPLQRLQRLFLAANRKIEPEAPPIAAFLSAIQLLLDAFVMGDSASRLIYISRPSILFYGLYGLSTPQGDTQVMLELIQRRGELAARLDCLLDCDCDQNTINAQILSDKALYDIDHVIDLFIQGQQVDGIPEYRMRAFGYANFIYVILNNNHNYVPQILNDEGDSITPNWEFGWEINRIFEKVVKLLWIDRNDLDAESVSLISTIIRTTATEALCQQLLSEDSWRRLVRIMAPSCRSPKVAANLIEAVVGQAMRQIDNSIVVEDAIFNCRNMKVYTPATSEESLDTITDEGLDLRVSLSRGSQG
ncbi:hypothetical protein [Nitrosomonas aestuarii]|nr:hypothetical protein [Nitrosomonas aestuarii]